MTITTETLLDTINAGHTKIQAAITAQADETTAQGARLCAVEQLAVELRNSGVHGGGGVRRPSWGQRVAVSEGLKAFQSNGLRGQARVELRNAIETASGLDQEGLVAPDRQPIQGLPQQRLTVRDLIPAVVTSSNKIDYVRQTSRENNAAPVAIGALKPESDLGFELAEAPVRTIAHWIPCPRQTFEDVSGLAALIDTELRFGLRLAEEHQILAGDGTGQNLLGIIPQAQQFAPPFETTLRHAWGYSKTRRAAVTVFDTTWTEQDAPARVDDQVTKRELSVVCRLPVFLALHQAVNGAAGFLHAATLADRATSAAKRAQPRY